MASTGKRRSGNKRSPSPGNGNPSKKPAKNRPITVSVVLISTKQAIIYELCRCKLHSPDLTQYILDFLTLQLFEQKLAHTVN